jgi:hypothetical protein
VARITVTPRTFAAVRFDARRLAALAAEVADLVGVPGDVDVHVAVDESTPFGYVRTRIDGRRVELDAESGAFEDPRRVRELSEPATRGVLGRVLFRVRDRRDPTFGDPPPDDALDLAQHAAWDVYALGRFTRLAGGAEEARRCYAFRLRHGFTDASDRVFERLWHGQDLTWADLEAACAETRAGRSAPAGS